MGEAARAPDAVVPGQVDGDGPAVPVAHRGRRLNTRGGPRVLRVVIKLTAAERASVAAMAQAQGISPPALFMRALLTGGSEAAAKFQRLRDELRASRRLLAAVSNNVNQLARQANAAAVDAGVPAVTAEQLTSALAAVERAAGRIEAVAGAAGEGQPGGLEDEPAEDASRGRAAGRAGGRVR